MDLDELRSVQSKERRKDSLQHLRDSFYEDVGAYLAERKRQRDERASSVDQPFSDEQVRKLSDEIETAEEVVESLYQRRVGKVVKLSSFAAAGAPTDTEGMTIQEAELFEDLVVRIEQNKDRVLDVLENGADLDIDVAAPAEAATTADADAPTPGAGSDAGASVDGATADASTDTPSPPPDTPPEHDDEGGVLADAMGGASASSDPDTTPTESDASTPTPATPSDDPASESAATTADSVEEPGEFVPGSEPDRAGEAGSGGESQSAESTDAGGDDTERQTVRVTRDVGQILGVDDIEYDLAADDVVTLPAANAGPLVERDAAEPIE
ncbi:hypothetical protein [Halobaculum marinum]|uniref:DNA replication factor GINS n=1 Tax=Halobaculum marinum TaxID=3031996 RepID=A0ABD5WZM6_9EURY|nr:hypothetical protein [Halobaculum sp. DT55]